MFARLFNRVTISLAVIMFLVVVWDWVKPGTSTLYTEAVAHYKDKNYEQSLKLLQTAYQIDSNDTAIMSLIGWDDLKLGDPKSAEPQFSRARTLTLPHPPVDLLLGYAYTEIQLGKFPEALQLLDTAHKEGADDVDYYIALGTLYRHAGHNRDAAVAFRAALDREKTSEVANKNLREIFSVTGDVRNIQVEFPPIVRPQNLTYPARVAGETLELSAGATWRPVYLTGVDLTAALPGSYPVDASTNPSDYERWLGQIGALGVNTISVSTILPGAFYRTLAQYNKNHSAQPLHLLQGISFADPPRDDLFNHDYYNACRKDVQDTIDVLHGQGDIPPTHAHSGGLYPDDLSAWVAGLVIGKPWLSHIVTGNNQLHPDYQSWQGAFFTVTAGNAMEVFLAEMLDYAAEYEEGKYNWQHPEAFATWPTLDPIRHPTESTLLEEIALRRSLGEHISAPSGPYDDDDAVSLNPLDLHSTARFPAGYFAAYAVFPFYPDFIERDSHYQAVSDAEGPDPFFGYLQDLKAHTAGIPLVITDYGVPTSLGIGHFSPSGFNEGGKTELEQGQLIARMTRNVYDSGAAGGVVFEWLDQWFRQSWVVHNFETPVDRKPLWSDFMDPAESYGLVAADPHRAGSHLLTGNRSEQGWTPFYADAKSGGGSIFQKVGDRYDPARDLKSLSVDADEGFLYLRLVVDKLDNDNDGQPDWKHVNYLIGISTAPKQAGLTYLPFIAPVRFPMGMTYALQLAGPEASHLLIASSYNPHQVVPVEGLPFQTVLSLKLGWKPRLEDSGTFEAQISEPNRRRFGRDGKYFPPARYERGILRYGDLDPKSPDYDKLAEWHANVPSNTIDIRIPWNLLNVTDPSSLRTMMGIEKDGTVTTGETPGFMFAAFSYRPLDAAALRPIMEQGQPIADALPGLTASTAIQTADLSKTYAWKGWERPQYDLRVKDSYAVLREALLSLPRSPTPGGQKPQQKPAPAPKAAQKPAKRTRR
jgi:tetratricopeptide (TPR) repeat protein